MAIRLLTLGEDGNGYQVNDPWMYGNLLISEMICKGSN